MEWLYKKDKLLKLFNEDPDLNEILGKKDKRPLNKYTDKNNPTAQELNERNLIIEYNKRVDKKQILPILKLNGINKEVLNFIMFDINDTDTSYYNKSVRTIPYSVSRSSSWTKHITISVCIFIALLSYIVKDLLCWTNSLGNQLKCIDDYGDIIDSRYYCRTLKFEIECPNNLYAGMNNKYDNFQRIWNWCTEIIGNSSHRIVTL